MSLKSRSLCRRSFWGRVLLASAAAGFALAAPVVALAGRPTTMPAGPRGDRSDHKDRPDHDRRSDREKGERGERGGDRGERFGPRREFKITDEQWAEIASFMKANSPNMWAVYEKLPEKYRNGARASIARRYDGLQKLEAREPSLYEVELRRVKVEDGIFGILGEIRKTRDAEPEGQRALKQQLRDKVEELWAVRMEDREIQLARIERQLQGFRMNDTLDALRKERDADAERKAEWVQSRYEYYLGHVGGRPGMIGPPGMIPGGRGRQAEGPASRNGENRRDGDRKDRKDGERKGADPTAGQPAPGDEKR